MTVVALSAAAADIRTYEQDGSLIEETRQIVRKPVAEMRMEEQKIVRYVERTVGEPRTEQQSYYVPITEYRLVPRVEGRWNPFVQSRWVYDRVPYTRYELRTNTVTIPAGRKELVPETQVVQIPVRKLRFVDEEKISRVVLGPAANSANPTMIARSPAANAVAPINPMAPNPVLPNASDAQGPISMATRPPNQYGGIYRVESEPPRQPFPTSVLNPSFQR